MNTPKLPPLPEPEGYYFREDSLYIGGSEKIQTYQFTPEQMQAYAIETTATSPLLQRIAELERQLEEARKDAERYRWLKEGCNDKGTRATHIAKEYFGFEWNAAIDAAMQKGQS